MPWSTDPEKRRRDARVYGAEYRRNRDAVIRRAAGVCEGCHHRHSRLQCDHIIPVSKGGTHSVTNLRALCAGPGSCKCHERKTAQEGGGYRQPGNRGTRPAADPPHRPVTQW
jgi:5-methylcytosine-specific restriction endonuclease McrA